MGSSENTWHPDPEVFGRMAQQVEDLHTMHAEGGCSNVKLAQQAITWLWIVGGVVTTGLVGWCGWLTYKIDLIPGLIKSALGMTSGG